MLILGIHGGDRFEHEPDARGIVHHDSSAVLLRDGNIVAAIEEERLNRIKHTNVFPVQAIRFCLQQGGCTFGDLDLIATNSSLQHADIIARLAVLEDANNRVAPDGRSQLAALFARAFGVDVADKLYFCNHQFAHGWSAFRLSGFSSSLVLSADGEGDGCSGMVFEGRGRRLTKLRELAITQSLGHLYERLTQVLGYSYFDEYKVMGLAPYGDSSRFAAMFDKCYALLPDGDYRLEPAATWLAYLDAAGAITQARRRGDAFTQMHRDFAAGLQAALERIALHVLRYYREQTGHDRLCLAGGVAHNCTLNGRVLYTGWFKEVFVQPAACDAGGALGAALSACSEHDRAEATGLPHVYLGTGIGNDDECARTLERWAPFVTYRKHADIARATAESIAAGEVVGWAQGRSEFGPRALGNRSILADPRPAENKLRINQMIKKREAYRPFAPSVLEERAADFFEIPPGQPRFPFMIFVLRVREEHRERLGAITHVDGTARVQTVSRDTNPLYWRLIAEFEALTGVPIVLNTSFNNNAEPIVDSLDDAIACFLTTGLTSLVAGNFLVSKLSSDEILEQLPRLTVEIPACRLLTERRAGTDGHDRIFELASTKSRNFGTAGRELSRETWLLLQSSEAHVTIGDLFEQLDLRPSARARVLRELMDLWQDRAIRCLPAPLVGSVATRARKFVGRETLNA